VEGRAYYILLRIKNRGIGEILFNIGGEIDTTTIIRLNGKHAIDIFKNIISLLSKQGAAVPVRITDREKVYSIREDLGPIIGAYMLLLRRARNYAKWHSFLEELLDEKYPGVASVLTGFLEMAIEFSKTRNISMKMKRYETTLSPIALDIFSTSLKHFVNRLISISRRKHTL